MLSKGGTQSEPVVRTVGHSARTSRQEARAEIAAVRAASGAVPVRACARTCPGAATATAAHGARTIPITQSCAARRAAEAGVAS
jgi:hypothetical protein